MTGQAWGEGEIVPLPGRTTNEKKKEKSIVGCFTEDVVRELHFSPCNLRGRHHGKGGIEALGMNVALYQRRTN